MLILFQRAFSRNLFFFAFLLSSLFLLTPSTQAQQYSASCDVQASEDLKRDCTALESLYDATGGASWTNNTKWKTIDPVGEWSGVTVSGGRVWHLSLTNNNLSGAIPDLSSLSLRYLHLNSNSLSGTITASDFPTSLWYLDLGNNTLSGAIPDLSRLASLQVLYLNNNSLSGAIPDLSSLSQLRDLYLNNNSLSGAIPDLSSLTSLQVLHLNDNKLSGTIPDLSSLTSLQVLHLNDNSLSGTIPDLSSLTSLRVLHLNNNSLSGTIPDLSSLTTLHNLYLNNNSLSGTIPDLSSSTGLQYLYLNNNKLSGTIPDLSSFSQLYFLYLNNNSLSGEINASYLPTTLYYMHLNGNSLSGTIPDLSSLANLYTLYLNNNKLSGEINASYLPTTLYHLILNGNSLSGTIPDLSSFSNLWFLYLNNNSLSGTITASDFPTSLKRLYLSSNSLSGTIPDLSHFSQLYDLYLNNNSLSGTITASDFPTSLKRLYLNDNSLSGTIPDLSRFSQLYDLYLSNNNLSGTIPDLSALTGILRLAYWGNPGLNWTSIPPPLASDTVIDRAALRSLYSANAGPDWRDSTNWLSSRPLGEWYGVTTDSSGRVTKLDLSGNGLKNPVSNSLEALGSLTTLNLSGNPSLSGTLPVRLKDISGLSNLNIRCTDVSTPSSNEFNTWLGGLGKRFITGVTGFEAPGSFVSRDDGSSEFQIKVSWDEIPNATYTITWEDSPRLGFSGVVGPAGKSYYETDGDKISYTIFGHYSNDAPARVTYTVSLTAVVDGCEDVSYGPVTVSTGLSTAPALLGGGTPGGGTPGGDNRDYTCPDYSPVVTAQNVERAKDPGTLATFVKEARTGVEALLRNTVSEEEGIRNLAECFGADGDWKHGSVHLFMISADEDKKFFLAPGDSELAGAPLDIEDENGCDVGEEILRAAGGEELQCDDLGLAGDDPGPGFVQYLWRDPDDPDSEGYDSPRLGYVEEIRFERFLPSGSFVLGSGYYPEISVPEPEGGASGSGGGCALVAETDVRDGAFIGLLLNVLAIGCAVFLGRGVFPRRG